MMDLCAYFLTTFLDTVANRDNGASYIWIYYAYDILSCLATPVIACLKPRDLEYLICLSNSENQSI